MKRLLNLLVLFAFCFSHLAGYGASAGMPLGYMSPPGVLTPQSPVFNAPLPLGIEFDPQNPLKFKFLMEKGSARLDETLLRREGNQAIRYFLAALALPAKDLWVNLSPYEQTRIAGGDSAQTDLGADLLGEDYVLKQLAASLTYPETPQGKEYWQSVNGVGANGRSPVQNNFTKIWIIPGEMLIKEDSHRAVIAKATLKVMMEEDYLAMNKNGVGVDPRVDPKQDNGRTHGSAPTDSFKKYILPLIEKEVNEGKNFSRLRQVYRAVMLAGWFRNKLRGSTLDNAYFDKNRIKGVDYSDSQIKEKIYQQYCEAFKKGAYNYVKRELPPTPSLAKRGSEDSALALLKRGPAEPGRVLGFGTRITRRQYFSGGAMLVQAGSGAPTAPLIGEMPKDAASLDVEAQLPGFAPVALARKRYASRYSFSSEAEKKIAELLLQSFPDQGFGPAEIFINQQRRLNIQDLEIFFDNGARELALEVRVRKSANSKNRTKVNLILDRDTGDIKVVDAKSPKPLLEWQVALSPRRPVPQHLSFISGRVRGLDDPTLSSEERQQLEWTQAVAPIFVRAALADGNKPLQDKVFAPAKKIDSTLTVDEALMLGQLVHGWLKEQLRLIGIESEFVAELEYSHDGDIVTAAEGETVVKTDDSVDSSTIGPRTSVTYAVVDGALVVTLSVPGHESVAKSFSRDHIKITSEDRYLFAHAVMDWADDLHLSAAWKQNVAVGELFGYGIVGTKELIDQAMAKPGEAVRAKPKSPIYFLFDVGKLVVRVELDRGYAQTAEFSLGDVRFRRGLNKEQAKPASVPDASAQSSRAHVAATIDVAPMTLKPAFAKWQPVVDAIIAVKPDINLKNLSLVMEEWTRDYNIPGGQDGFVAEALNDALWQEYGIPGEQRTPIIRLFQSIVDQGAIATRRPTPVSIEKSIKQNVSNGHALDPDLSVEKLGEDISQWLTQLNKERGFASDFGSLGQLATRAIERPDDILVASSGRKFIIGFDPSVRYQVIDGKLVVTVKMSGYEDIAKSFSLPQSNVVSTLVARNKDKAVVDQLVAGAKHFGVIISDADIKILLGGIDTLVKQFKPDGYGDDNAVYVTVTGNQAFCLEATRERDDGNIEGDKIIGVRLSREFMDSDGVDIFFALETTQNLSQPVSPDLLRKAESSVEQLGAEIGAVMALVDRETRSQAPWVPKSVYQAAKFVDGACKFDSEDDLVAAVTSAILNSWKIDARRKSDFRSFVQTAIQQGSNFFIVDRYKVTLTVTGKSAQLDIAEMERGQFKSTAKRIAPSAATGQRVALTPDMMHRKPGARPVGAQPTAPLVTVKIDNNLLDSDAAVLAKQVHDWIGLVRVKPQYRSENPVSDMNYLYGMPVDTLTREVLDAARGVEVKPINKKQYPVGCKILPDGQLEVTLYTKKHGNILRKFPLQKRADEVALPKPAPAVIQPLVEVPTKVSVAPVVTSPATSTLTSEPPAPAPAPDVAVVKKPMLNDEEISALATAVRGYISGFSDADKRRYAKLGLLDKKYDTAKHFRMIQSAVVNPEHRKINNLPETPITYRFDGKQLIVVLHIADNYNPIQEFSLPGRKPSFGNMFPEDKDYFDMQIGEYFAPLKERTGKAHISETEADAALVGRLDRERTTPPTGQFARMRANIKRDSGFTGEIFFIDTLDARALFYSKDGKRYAAAHSSVKNNAIYISYRAISSNSLNKIEDDAFKIVAYELQYFSGDLNPELSEKARAWLETRHRWDKAAVSRGQVVPYGGVDLAAAMGNGVIGSESKLNGPVSAADYGITFTITGVSF